MIAGNGTGVLAQSGAAAGVSVRVTRSSIVNNVTNGARSDATAGQSASMVSSSNLITGNGTGLSSAGAGASLVTQLNNSLFGNLADGAFTVSLPLQWTSRQWPNIAPRATRRTRAVHAESNANVEQVFGYFCRGTDRQRHYSSRCTHYCGRGADGNSRKMVIQFCEDINVAPDNDAELRVYEPSVSYSVRQVVDMARPVGLKLENARSYMATDQRVL